jgi:hypothetical protein
LDLWDVVQQRLGDVRASVRSAKIRQTGFWKARRAKHLLTGLIHCGGCGNSLAAVGSDYLACSAARNGAGCDNRKGVRRTRLEAAVLDGLKHRLMAPEYVEKFIRALAEETNALRPSRAA